MCAAAVADDKRDNDHCYEQFSSALSKLAHTHIHDACRPSRY